MSDYVWSDNHLQSGYQVDNSRCDTVCNSVHVMCVWEHESQNREVLNNSVIEAFMRSGNKVCVGGGGGGGDHTRTQCVRREMMA